MAKRSFPYKPICFKCKAPSYTVAREAKTTERRERKGKEKKKKEKRKKGRRVQEKRTGTSGN